MNHVKTLLETELPPSWMPSEMPSPLLQDPRTLPAYRFYRRLRKIVLSLGKFQSAAAVAEYLLPALLEDSGEPGAVFLGGRAYRFEGDHFALFAKAGNAGKVPFGYQVPSHYPVMEKLQRDGWALIYPEDPLFDPVIEDPLGGEPLPPLSLAPRKSA